MAYDPKKKRPQRDSLDAVVDEIFGEEPESSKPAKPTAKKTSTAKKPVAKKSPAPVKAAKKPAVSHVKKTPPLKVESQDDAPLNNVLPLYPEAPETPLIMQPQVWVATGIAALLVLFIARGRKRR